MRKLIAAIDFGTSKTVCLVGEKTEEGVKIIAYKQCSSKGIKRGEIINIQNVLDTVMPALQNVEQTMGLKINEVIAGISGRNIKCTATSNKSVRKNADEMISKEEIDNLTAEVYNTFVQTGEKILHVIPQSYNIDDYMGVTEPIGMIGKEIGANYKIFIGKSNSAQYLNNVIQRTKLKLRKLYLAPHASANAGLTSEEKEVGSALADIGAGTTELTIIIGNTIRYTAVIPFGGNSITDDICKGCGLSAKQAEDVKIAYGSCLSSSPTNNDTISVNAASGRETKEISRKFLSKIIEARTSEILEAIDYEIERSGYKSQLNGGLILTGGTSRLLHITKLANIITGLEVKTSTPSFSVTCDSVEEVNNPESSTAVGLILYGFEKMEADKSVAPAVGEIEKHDLFSIDNITEKQNKEKDSSEEDSEDQEKKKKDPKDDSNGGKGKGFKSFLDKFKNDSIFKTNNQA